MNKNGLSCFRSIIDIIIPLMEDAATLDKSFFSFLPRKVNTYILIGVPDKPDLQLVDCYDMYARVDPENSDSKSLVLKFIRHNFNRFDCVSLV